jgi:sugar lactone lactonase YvrE
MKDRRLKRFWYRAGPLAAAGAILTGGAVMGCGSDSPTTAATSTSGDTTTSTSSGMGGAGGNGTGGASTTSTGTGGQTALAIGGAADVRRPFDATPNPDGTEVYFTADGANGLGVYKSAADGTEPTPLAVYPTAVDPNNPFGAPFGIAISTDGKTLFVADTDSGVSGRGAIYTLPVGGGVPTVLAGTDGVAPRSLDVFAVGAADSIYFSGTGVGPGGLPGIFSIPAGGGALTTIAAGGILRDPAGVVVAKNGDVYAVDTIASGSNTAQILVIPSGGAPKVLVDNVRVGYPAGIALSFDEKRLYVSGFNSQELTDRLLVIEIVEPKPTEMFKAELGMFTESGGIHRAKKSDVFALVDSSAGPKGGKVFVIK